MYVHNTHMQLDLIIKVWFVLGSGTIGIFQLTLDPILEFGFGIAKMFFAIAVVLMGLVIYVVVKKV